MTEFELLEALGTALQDMNWSAVDALCPTLVSHIRTRGAKPPIFLLRTLNDLRSKRRFACMIQVAEAFTQAGVVKPFVRRQYAQALIDTGMVSAAVAVLTELVVDGAGTDEESEARGLIGRAFKQMFVASGGTNVAALQRAINEYAAVYKQNRTRN